jgi:uroporphyrinogen-III decarboxylase
VPFLGTIDRPYLLEMVMGLEPFYYLCQDHPQEMDALIRVIHERQLDAFRALSEDPWSVGILCENTSTAYISPGIYERYNMPHQRDYVDIMHRHGKAAILHMCGHVRGILHLIRETRCDGIHALTPAPTGDCPWEAALDELGEELVIIGILDPSIFIMGPIDRIGEEMSARITPRLREANFILWPAADGVAVSPERFRAVQRWFAENVE